MSVSISTPATSAGSCIALQIKEQKMNKLKRWGWIAIGLSGLLPALAAAQEGRGDVVYVPTPQIVVDEMLGMAKVGAGDYVIDLGSGDGRMVITAVKKFGARALGVDLDTYLLRLANANAKKEGVTDRATFVEQNLFETDLSKATVVTTYLLPEMNLKLRPKIMALKPGTRVAAHDYHMGSWQPDEQKDIPVPEKQVGNPGLSYLFLWYVPARVGGTWKSEINVGGRDTPYEFFFDQLFQIVDGGVRAGNRNATFIGRVKADRISMLVPKAGEAGLRHEFEGRVNGDTIEGTVKIGEGAAQREVKWVAKQVERRELRRASDDAVRE
jgi:hypothetical protein